MFSHPYTIADIVLLLILICIVSTGKSLGSSVGISLDHGLDDRGSRVLFPVGGGGSNFSLHHRAQHGSGAHPASYPKGNRGSFPGVKRPGLEADHTAI
jgi:hypothetical protein